MLSPYREAAIIPSEPNRKERSLIAKVITRLKRLYLVWHYEFSGKKFAAQYNRDDKKYWKNYRIRKKLFEKTKVGVRPVPPARPKPYPKTIYHE